MLTRPEVDKAEANSHEVEAKIALSFLSHILHFQPIFPQNPNIFDCFSTRFQKFLLKTGFNMGTLLVNTPKTTSYVSTHWIENAIS